MADPSEQALRDALTNLKPGASIEGPGGMRIVKDPALDSDQFYIMQPQAQQYSYIRELQQHPPRQNRREGQRLLDDGMYGLPGASKLMWQMAAKMNAEIARQMGIPDYQRPLPPIPLRTSPFITLENQRMNLSAAVMLFEENGVRPVKVEYDPEKPGNNNPNVVFKTVDETLKVGDIVVVESHTRHKFTTAKVTHIGFADVPVDFENPQRWGWIVQKCDTDAYDNILAGEKNLIGKVAEANANKMRADLKNAMGLDKVDLASVFGKRDEPVLAAPAPARGPAPEPVTPPPNDPAA